MPEKTFPREAVKVKGEGSLRFENDRLINLQRSNTEERFELLLRHHIYNGNECETIPKDDLITGRRKLRISCDAKAVGAGHTLVFVVKDVITCKWLANERIRVDSNI